MREVEAADSSDDVIQAICSDFTFREETERQSATFDEECKHFEDTIDQKLSAFSFQAPGKRSQISTDSESSKNCALCATFPSHCRKGIFKGPIPHQKSEK